MQVARIWGVSYSGSTALGYALNTASGFFFGSEVRRITQAISAGTSPPVCDLCGIHCEYWNQDLYDFQPLTLGALYSAFGNRYPEVSVFVDGSKSAGHYRSYQAAFNFVVAKHPLRLLSSYVYNNRVALGLPDIRFEDVGRYVDLNLPVFAPVIDAYFDKTSARYRRFYSILKDRHFLVQIDRAHRDDFSTFRRIEKYLGVEEKAIRERSFSSYLCHSIGGNRAPVWIAQQGRSSTSDVANPRKDYYLGQSRYGDWKIDDKYRIMILGNTLDYCFSSKSFRRLADLLGYKDELI